MSKICFFTSTRADFGIMCRLINIFTRDSKWQTDLIVGGTHLLEAYGKTVNEIINEGIEPSFYIYPEGTLNDSINISSYYAKVVSEAALYLSKLKPDIFVVLGDRYETHAAVSASILVNIPVAHIHGGELTYGSIDDYFRHSITKLSTLHFPATEKYRNRIIQMGEQSERVFNVGALGVENILKTSLYSKDEVFKKLGIHTDKPVILMTYHPETFSNQMGTTEIEFIMEYIASQSDFNFVLTKANGDAGGQRFNEIFDFYANNYGHIYLYASLGHKLYLSLAKYALLVMGNSSSGIIEVPSLGVPVINIGKRQMGRECAKEVLHCDDVSRLDEVFNIACDREYRNKCTISNNPYQGVDTSNRIKKIIEEYIDKEIFGYKVFNDN